MKLDEGQIMELKEEQFRDYVNGMTKKRLVALAHFCYGYIKSAEGRK